MKTYKFSLPIKPFSVNAMTYRDTRFKTAEFKSWANEVRNLLEEHKPLLDMAMDFKDASQADFEVQITVLYPQHIFFNKLGQISAKTMDVSNIEKPLIDIIFKDFMDVDDRHIWKLISTKEPGANQRIDINIILETDRDNP